MALAGTSGSKAGALLLGSGIVLALLVINSLWFPLVFDQPYWRWYLQSGSLISLLTAVLAAAWGKVDKVTGLVDLHPLGYAGSCMQFGSLVLLATGGALRKSNQPDTLHLWDRLLSLPLMLVIVIAVLTWLLIIAPAQYLVFAVCGAPARLIRGNSYRLYASYEHERLAWQELRQGDAPPQGDWWDATLRDKPVTLTSLVSAGVLMLVRWLLPLFGV